MVLPKKMRLKGYRCFDYIHKHSKRYYGNSIILKIAPEKPYLEKGDPVKDKSIKCAVSISNKVSKRAVMRNRLRRLIHEQIKKRLSSKNTPNNIWLLISIKPNSLNKPSDNLFKEFDQLLFRAGLLS